MQIRYCVSTFAALFFNLIEYSLSEYVQDVFGKFYILLISDLCSGSGVGFQRAAF